MPAMYETVRDKLVRDGMPEKEAKTRAAKIYNAWASKHGKRSLAHTVKKERGGFDRGK